MLEKEHDTPIYHRCHYDVHLRHYFTTYIDLIKFLDERQCSLEVRLETEHFILAFEGDHGHLG